MALTTVPPDLAPFAWVELPEPTTEHEWFDLAGVADDGRVFFLLDYAGPGGRDRAEAGGARLVEHERMTFVDADWLISDAAGPTRGRFEAARRDALAAHDARCPV